ncbi:hypothetical protein [Rathayibacter sp. Leaf296]|uniref:hypothetical protein n=1 Tax=Rathayibacter sp. Leaf296 TaxID=1736327 RepID=UPI000B1A247E|nr:hypothetical protein [Rathayibacter sp. Leaf296]
MALSRFLTPGSRPSRSRTPRRLDVLAVATAALVTERFLDPHFTPARLAQELRVPVLTLRVRFRRSYGFSIDEHLARCRTELAAVLMASTPHRLGALEEIARASGYRGVVPLDRDFRRWRGTPALAAWFRMGSSRGTAPAPPAGAEPDAEGRPAVPIRGLETPLHG